MSLVMSFFGQLTHGKISRFGFLWRALVVFVVLAGISVALGLNGGIVHYAILYLPLAALLGFAFLNIAAKRLRDMGLNGWAWLALALGLGWVMASLIPGPVEFAFGALAFLVLILWPGRRQRA